MFASPLAQFIHPKGWVRPAGNNEPTVTATFADHIAGKRPPGVDIGTGRCGDALYAMCDGVVSLAGLVGYPTPNALTVRIRDGKGYEPATTHMGSIATGVKVGVTVKRGQLIGTLGKSGADACHVHMGLKRLINGAWVEIDGWPLLDQNMTGGDMLPIPGANYQRLANKKATLKTSGNFRDERKSGAVLQLFPTATVIYPVAYANDGDVPSGSQSGEWFYCFLYVTNKGVLGGWFHSSVVGPLVEDVAVGAGFTQAQLDAAVKAATDPLSARIAAIKAKVAAGASDIADD